MGFCPFSNKDKLDVNSACIISCALYDLKTKQCSIKLIAENLKKIAQSNDKEVVKN